ncbi:MAG TPA: phenylalanine--tRNA ligase beta subunit-related protein [Candidatus Angelobacter sp.]
MTISDVRPERALYDIQIELRGAKAGVVEARKVQVMSCEIGLSEEISATCDRFLKMVSIDSLPHWEQIHAVRKMFREWRNDPSKYRPSSEALLRRVLKRQPFPRISNIVDIANLGAIETGFPHGCYDGARISGPVEIRQGDIGEEYDGIGRQTFRLEGRPVFSDIHGPFGCPVSDSTRTMVTPSTKELLAIILAPESISDLMLGTALSLFVRRLECWCGATGLSTRVVGRRLSICPVSPEISCQNLSMRT